MSAYLGSTKVWSQADANGWVRPADWLPLPAVSASEQKLVGLYAVFPGDGNFAAFRCSGNYTVDWGDGTTQNVAGGTTATHEYSYSDADLDGTLTSRGYKQAIITITPQSGQSLTSVNLQYRYSSIVYSSTGWLEIDASLPSCTIVPFAGTEVGFTYLEKVTLRSLGSVTSFRLQGCGTLKSLVLGNIGNSSLTSLEYAFYNCYSLPRVDLSNVNLSYVTNLGSAFRSCFALEEIIFPTSTIAAVTNFSLMCDSCYTLRTIENLDSFTTALATTFSSMFGYCYSLNPIDLSTFTTPSGCTTTSMFNSCKALTSLVFPSSESFNASYCKLSAAGLDALYTSLGTGTGKTIYVKGNYGTTGHTPSIATAKGWTVNTTT